MRNTYSSFVIQFLFDFTHPVVIFFYKIDWSSDSDLNLQSSWDNDLLKWKRFKKTAWIQSHHLLRQNIAGWRQQTFCFQKFVNNAQQCFAFTPQANFPTHNLNFHWRWRWCEQIQAIFLYLFYFIEGFKLQLKSNTIGSVQKILWHYTPYTFSGTLFKCFCFKWLQMPKCGIFVPFCRQA